MVLLRRWVLSGSGVAPAVAPARRLLLHSLLPILLIGAAPAFGTMVRRMTLEEVVAAADQVVRARVESSRSFWRGSQIWTEVTLNVARTCKGPARSRQRFLQMGGRVESPVPLDMTVPGTPVHRPGDDAFFFLEPGGPDQKIIVGLFHGHVPVRRDPSGEYVMHGGRRLHPAEFEEMIRRAIASQPDGPGENR